MMSLFTLLVIAPTVISCAIAIPGGLAGLAGEALSHYSRDATQRRTERHKRIVEKYK
jgi:hypothetical protein